MAHLLLLDCEDSFSHLLADRLRLAGDIHITVRPEKQASGADLAGADALILSPGPGMPSEHPAATQWLAAAPPNMPVLGICLGFQIIGLHFGARLRHLPQPRHGMQAQVHFTPCSLTRGQEREMAVGLYHSYALEQEPPSLRFCAWDEEGVPMALQHRTRPVFGLQFHPESILSPEGHLLLENFYRLAAASAGSPR